MLSHWTGADPLQDNQVSTFIEMTAEGTLAVALTPAEINSFLPEGMYADLLGISDTAVSIDPTMLSAEDFHLRIEQANPDVLVALWKTPALPTALPSRLKYLCYMGGSIKNLVSRVHLEKGLLVSNWGSSISRVVAEAGLMLILTALRRAGYWLPAMQRDGAWNDSSFVTSSLFGRRVGIHGFGRVAQELISLLRPFGVDLTIYAPGAEPALYVVHGARKGETLAELFSENQIVVELAPLVPTTLGIVTEAVLRQIPPGGVFVNLGRGAVVDEEGLCRVAREGRILVALDVYTKEPLAPDSPLRGLPNVILSPHIAGPTADRARDAGAMCIRNVRRYFEGSPVENVVTREIFDTST